MFRYLATGCCFDQSYAVAVLQYVLVPLGTTDDLLVDRKGNSRCQLIQLSEKCRETQAGLNVEGFVIYVNLHGEFIAVNGRNHSDS